jgi:hypothetical protein
MPSLFPGMDPYLESAVYWRDLHTCLITHIRAALQPLLRPHYNARIEERLYVTSSRCSIYADVSVHRLQTREAPAAYATAEAPPAEPTDQPIARPWIVSLDDEPPTQTYIEIIRVDSREVVTVIEVLSPANKALGDGAEEYAPSVENCWAARSTWWRLICCRRASGRSRSLRNATPGAVAT